MDYRIKKIYSGSNWKKNIGLTNIANSSPFLKITAIDKYMNDFSSFDTNSMVNDLKVANPSITKDQLVVAVNEYCQERLWNEFRSALKECTYFWSLTCMKHQMMNKTPGFHLTAYKALADNTKKYKCFVRFRGSAKTAQKTNDILHNICECLEPVMILISSAVALASNEIIDIRSEIDGNDIIKYIYGDLAGKDIWNTKALEFANGVYISAKGTTSQIRGTKWKGQRPTKVYLDDFEDEKNADTDEKRKNLRRWFSAQILPIGDVGMQVVMFGTIVHPDAYLANADPKWNEITKEFDNPSSMFAGKNGYYSRVDIADKNGNPVWKERYDKEWIEEQRKIHTDEHTLAFFYQEYFNIPAQESNPIIDPNMVKPINGIWKHKYGIHWIETYAKEDVGMITCLSKIPINVFIGIDPTKGNKASSDNFSMTALGVTNNKDMIFLKIFSKVLPIKLQAPAVANFVNECKPTHFTIETYGYQLALSLYVEDELELLGYTNYVKFNFEEPKSKKTKYKESLTNPIANGKMSRLASCDNWDVFENEASKYSGGETEKDDSLDSTALAAHEDPKAGKVLWGPGIKDVDEALVKAAIRIKNFKSNRKISKSFMGW